MGSSRPIASNTTADCSVDTEGDIDYFILTLAESGPVTLASTGTTDTTVILRDSAGNEIAANDDGGAGHNFLVEQVLNAGVYLVEVRGFGSSVGAYRLHVAFSSLDQCGTSLSDAVDVAPNSITLCALEVGGDNDYFRLVLNQPGSISLFSTGTLDTFGSVLGADGQVLAGNDDDGVDANFLLVGNVAAGTYFLQVSGFNPGVTGEYRVGVIFEAASGESDLCGASVGDAVSVSVTSVTPCDIATGGDIDYFNIELTEPGTLVVSSLGEIDTLGALFDSAGTRLAIDDDSGANRNFRIERELSPGSYQVQVSGFGENVTGVFDLAVEFAAATTAEDTCGSSETASVGLAGSLSGCAIEFAGDFDFFAIDIAETALLAVATTGETDTLGTLYGPDGSAVATDDDSGTNANFSLEIELSAGTYLLVVRTYNEIDTGEYSIAMTTSTPSTSTADDDADGIVDSQDNCPAIANANQSNFDGDTLGDICDDDDDDDGVADATDDFPYDSSRTVAEHTPVQKVIIVAGGGPERNELWPATQLVANFAYQSLKAQGFTPESIQYLSEEANNPDVDAAPTIAEFESAILNWTMAGVPADDVLMYVVDHGGEGYFRLNADTNLTAARLDSWLD